MSRTGPWSRDGDTIGKPVREMREYVGVVRAILHGEDPPTGERFRSGFRLMGCEPRPELPIYVAGLSPAMLRLAGEIADGVVLWLCTAGYVREVVLPEVTKGRERAGKGFSLPFYRAMIERSGYAEDVAGFDRGMEQNDPDAATAAISDRYLADLAAIGSTEEAQAALGRYREAGASSPCVGAVPKTDFDSTLEALAGSL